MTPADSVNPAFAEFDRRMAEAGFDNSTPGYNAWELPRLRNHIRRQLEQDRATRGEPVRKSGCEVIRTSRAPARTAEDWEETSLPDEGDASFASVHDETAFAREAFYREVCENGVGRDVGDEMFARIVERRDQKDAQTIRMAKALECRGGRFYHGEDWGSRCTVIDVFNGDVLPLPPVKRVSFLPSIAAQQRSKMLKDVERFIEERPLECRMFTLTRGQRVVFETPEQFRATVQAFSRVISRLQTLPPFRRFLEPRRKRGQGPNAKRRFKQVVSIEWRSIEFGTPQWDMGRLTLALHAHLLVRECEHLSGKKRRRFRRLFWRVWSGAFEPLPDDKKRVWDDAGVIQNAREFVKYPVKPGDLEAIAQEGGPGQLLDLYEALRGLHIVQPMGELRRVRRVRRAKADRIQPFSGPDGRELREGPDWNAGKRPFADRSAREEWRKRRDAIEAKRGWCAFPRVMTPEAFEGVRALVSRDGDETPIETGKRPGGTPRVSNRIIARLAPAPYSSGICTPAVVVWGYDGNLAAVLAQPIVQRIRAEHGEAFDAALAVRAALTRVGACAPSRAGAHAAGKTRQGSNNCPHGSWPEELLLAMSDPPGGASGAN